MTDEAADARLRSARVARLATRDERGRPHVIPVCYAYDGRCFYIPVDQKPKRVSAKKLTRVRNIESCPDVAFVVDEYQEDWSRLWYVLVRGRATIITHGQEQGEALRLLREKYKQYVSSKLLPEDAPVIRVVPAKITSWGELGP